MFCASKFKIAERDGIQLLDEIKEIDKKKRKCINLDLSENKLKFRLFDGKWRGKYSDAVDETYQEKKKNDKLRKELKEKDEICKRLEKEYLMKMVKMLQIAHVHCDLKKYINDEFVNLGLAKPINMDKQILEQQHDNFEYEFENNPQLMQSNFEKENNEAY